MLVVWNIKYINITDFVFIFVIKHRNEIISRRFNEMEYSVTFDNYMLFCIYKRILKTLKKKQF